MVLFRKGLNLVFTKYEAYIPCISSSKQTNKRHGMRSLLECKQVYAFLVCNPVINAMHCACMTKIDHHSYISAHVSGGGLYSGVALTI